MEEIKAEAAPGATHPPKRASDRTDLLPVLDAALANDDAEVRLRAIHSLAYMKCRDALPLLLKSLASEDAQVRYYGVMGLEWLADAPDLRPKIVEALIGARDRKEEDHFDVRLHAAAALVKLGEPQDPGIFIEALKNEHANEALAAGALATLGCKEAIELIVKRLATAVPSSDHWCAVALEKLTGEKFDKDAAKWGAWLEANRAKLPEQAK